MQKYSLTINSLKQEYCGEFDNCGEAEELAKVSRKMGYVVELKELEDKGTTTQERHLRLVK